MKTRDKIIGAVITAGLVTIGIKAVLNGDWFWLWGASSVLFYYGMED